MVATSKQADAVFFDALGFEDKAEQIAFVEKVCEGNDALRHEVDSLFSSLDKMDDFLEDGTPLWITAKDLYDTLSNLL